MKVTGYQLKEAIKMKGLELDTIQSQFDESLHVFEGEDKLDPKNVVAEVKRLEWEIALLQTVQAHYNLSLDIALGDKKEVMRLCTAIKLVGGAGRMSKMWRTAAKGRVRDRWDRKNLVVKRADEEVAQPTITKQEALDEARIAERFASQLRGAISVGNTTEIDTDWVGLEDIMSSV